MREPNPRQLLTRLAFLPRLIFTSQESELDMSMNLWLHTHYEGGAVTYLLLKTPAMAHRAFTDEGS